MLLLSKLTLAIVLAVVVQCVDGNQRIINVNELISDDYDFFASGAYDNSHICCVCGNCSCNSLDHALANLTSNVLINITTDVTLSSMVRVSHQLADVSIIGHNNPTVNCKNVGGLRFTCLNCVIQGITWDGCGTTSINNNTEPGLNLDYCYNITIQSCSFWRSVGPAVILRNVLGDVNINNCKFMNNNHYIGHGAAIQYSFLFPRSSLDFFTITNCNFSYNKVKSLVYLESRSTYFHRYHKTIFINSTFSNNQGISIHVFNHNIYFTGKVLFQNNTAENGAGIYISDHSTVTFDKNSDVKFIQNSADHRGSAIFLRKNSVGLFDQNSVVTFNNNKVTNGTIYCEDSSNVIFKGTCQVTFSGNSATQHGAAIHSVNNSHVTITDNSKVTLKHNFISYDGYKLLSPVGGIITSYDNCNINFEGNSITMFANNIANSGGAIYTRNGYVTFEGHSSTMFNNNVAKSEGGAIVSYNSHISFDRNSTTVFTENAADLGGAIMCIFSNISFEGNTTFKNNKATNGTIFSQDNSNVIFRGNCKAFFIGNSAVQYGGAVCSSDNSHITFTEHSNVTFTNNTGHYGGAILAHRNSIVSFKDNSAVVFINNDANSFGGAIFSGVYSIVKFQDSSIVRFTHNAAHNGGALVSTEYSSVVYNDNTRVTHYHNKARHNGGVFYSLRSTLHFDGNSTISLIYNEAVQNGGVMHLAANSEVSFLRFADVTFNYNNAIYGGALSANDESKSYLRIIQWSRFIKTKPKSMEELDILIQIVISHSMKRLMSYLKITMLTMGEQYS